MNESQNMGTINPALPPQKATAERRFSPRKGKPRKRETNERTSDVASVHKIYMRQLPSPSPSVRPSVRPSPSFFLPLPLCDSIICSCKSHNPVICPRTAASNICIHTYRATRQHWWELREGENFSRGPAGRPLHSLDRRETVEMWRRGVDLQLQRRG